MLLLILLVSTSLVVSLSFLVLRVCKSTHSVLHYYWQEGIMRQETTVLRNWTMAWPSNSQWYICLFFLNHDSTVRLWYCGCSDFPRCVFWGSNVCPMLSYYLSSLSFVTQFSKKFTQKFLFAFHLFTALSFLTYADF
jgi:hypothetical protein